MAGAGEEAERADEARQLPGVEAVVASIDAAVAFRESWAGNEAPINFELSAGADTDAPV